MNKKLTIILFIAIATTANLSITLNAVFGSVIVPSLFSDHMVLQRNMPINVWGWAEPGEKVSVTLNGITRDTLATASGKWKIVLPKMYSKKPLSLRIKGTNEIIINDVLLGEVWIASGQSNMVWPVANSSNSEFNVLGAKKNHGIRFFKLNNIGSQSPQSQTTGIWQIASEKSIPQFSAVAYSFSQILHNILDTPIGIIQNAWGGSTAESWVSRDTIKQSNQLKPIHDQWLKLEENYNANADQEIAMNNIFLEKEKVHRSQNVSGSSPSSIPTKLYNKLTGPQRPGNLWNSRVLPIAPYSVQGVIWYQGESNSNNTYRAKQYRHIFGTLINEWRNLWGYSLSFYWAQIANYKEPALYGLMDSLPYLRESQTSVLNDFPDTGQAILIDLGETNDIHPKEKEEVGRRLARWALNRNYGYSTMAYRSPQYDSWHQEGGKVVVNFNFVNHGLTTLGNNEVEGFIVRKNNGDWLSVKGVIEDESSVVIKVPGNFIVDAIRYAWANNPICNLYSSEGLPATPFRSDTE